MEFCPHCMNPAQGPVCAKCGGSLNHQASPAQLRVGTPLRSQNGTVYMVGAAKGMGGFGITYAALDTRRGTRVAIKEYYPTRCASRGQNGYVIPMGGQQDVYLGGKKSFLEEAMLLSAVSALPSVVSVRDYFEANGTAYIVMEYVDGLSLSKVLAQRNGPMSPDELLPKLPQLLKDLNTMHVVGVIHRDIAPDNLILMPNGTLKLIDFGSARSVQDGKSMTVVLKTGFSPVEQYQSKGQGSYTDVYALAATIYYCLTGTVPPASVNRLYQDTLVPPSQRGVNLRKNQEQALLMGMTVQPKSRLQTMRDFAARLGFSVTGWDIANSGQSVPGPNPGPVPPVPPGPNPAPSPGLMGWFRSLDETKKILLITGLVAGGVLTMVMFVAIIVALA